MPDYDTPAIDTVVNLMTSDVLALRAKGSGGFFSEKFGQDPSIITDGTPVDAMLRMMDAAGIERGLLVAAKVGQQGLPGSWHLPYTMVRDAVAAHPDRFSGLAGLDPTEGMDGVRALQEAVEDFGFVGAHGYPHWFELAPDHARWYPFYAKCVELDVPILLQVGQSLIYHPKRPLRSVGQPITLDAVACDFPELKLVGIHIGIPWHSEMIAMAWKHPNVHIIADAHAPKHWPTEFVRYIDSYGQDKVIFGTDWPVLPFERFRNEVEGLGLRDGPKRKFLYENAKRLFKLP